MPFIFTVAEITHPDSTPTNATMAEEENANPNNTKKRKLNNQRIEKKDLRKSERTPKKRTRYAPHQTGMEVQVNVATVLMARTTVEDEGDKIDFEDVTHRVTSGEFESYEGFMTSGEDDSPVILRLIKNQSGHKMTAMTRAFEKTEVQELDSYDMLAFIDVKTAGGEEDEALIKYEQQRWECTKCQQSNSNDAGYCPKMVEGKRCGGTKQYEKKSWTGCFAQVCDLFFSFFVTSSILKTDTTCALRVLFRPHGPGRATSALHQILLTMSYVWPVMRRGVNDDLNVWLIGKAHHPITVRSVLCLGRRG